MRSVSMLVVGITSLILLGGFTLYGFVIQPGNQFVEEHRVDFQKQSVAFLSCLENEEADICKDRFMTDEARKTTSSESLEIISKKMKTNLGRRLASTPNEESLRWQKNISTTGTRLSIYLNQTVHYEKDPAASEEFTLIQEPNGNFRVHAFRINSNQMLK